MYRLVGRLIVGGFKFVSKMGSKSGSALSQGAFLTTSAAKAGTVVRTIQTTAVTAEKAGGVVKYVPKGLSKIFGKSGGYSKIVSAVYAPIKTSARWFTPKSLLSKGLNLAFLGLTAKEIYDYFNGSEEGENGTTVSNEELSLKELGQIEKGANVTKKLTELSNTNDIRTLAHDEDLVLTLINHLFVSKRFIVNADLDDRAKDILVQLQQGDRLRGIELLNSIAKAFVDDSDFPDMLEAFRLQCSISRLTDSQRTNALDFILENGVQRSEAFKSACQAYTETIRRFNEELSLSASDDFFEDTTFQLFDMFDLLPWGDRASYQGDSEVKGQQGAAFLSTSLATDVSFALVDSFIDRFTVDSDGEDDETAAIDLLMKHQKMSDQNNIARFRLMGGSDINASQIYSRN